MKVGELIRIKRQEKHYTLETVANEVEVSINYISKLEKGKNRNPSDDIIVKLARTLELDEDSLFKLFGKVSLSVRQLIENHPTLENVLSQLSRKSNIEILISEMKYIVEKK